MEEIFFSFPPSMMFLCTEMMSGFGFLSFFEELVQLLIKKHIKSVNYMAATQSI